MNQQSLSPESQPNINLSSRPGSLTPVASSPLPFGINSTSMPTMPTKPGMPGMPENNLPKYPSRGIGLNPNPTTNQSTNPDPSPYPSYNTSTSPSPRPSQKPKATPSLKPSPTPSPTPSLMTPGRFPKIMPPSFSVPMVSMLGNSQYNVNQPTPQGTVPIIGESNSSTQEISRTFSLNDLSVSLTTLSVTNLPPSLSTATKAAAPPVALQLPLAQIHPVQLPSNYIYSVQRTPAQPPLVSLPLIKSPSTPFPTVTLSSTSFPTATLPSVQLQNINGDPLVNLPNLSGVNLPRTINLPSVLMTGSSHKLGLSKIVTLGTFVPTTLADNEIGDLRWNRPNPPRPISAASSYRRIGCIGDGSCFFHAIAKGLSEIYQFTYRRFENVSEATLRTLESAVNRVVTFPSTLFTTPRRHDPKQRYTFSKHYGKIAFQNMMAHYRGSYVKMLRQDFAHQILNNQYMQSLIRQRLSGSIDLRIDTIIASALERGIILDREQVKEQAFRDVTNKLAQELLSGNAVQPDFMLLLSDYANIDIYLLRDADLFCPNPINTPLYGGVSLHAAVHGPRHMRPEADIYVGKPNRRAIVIISVDDYHYEIVARVDEPESQERNREIHPNMSQDEPLIHHLYKMLANIRAGK